MQVIVNVREKLFVSYLYPPITVSKVSARVLTSLFRSVVALG
jgi:hypothetical protein